MTSDRPRFDLGMKSFFLSLVRFVGAFPRGKRSQGVVLHKSQETPRSLPGWCEIKRFMIAGVAVSVMPCHSEGAGTGHTAQQGRQQGRRPKNPPGVQEILQSPGLPQDDRNAAKLCMLFLRGLSVPPPGPPAIAALAGPGRLGRRLRIAEWPASDDSRSDVVFWVGIEPHRLLLLIRRGPRVPPVD